MTSRPAPTEAYVWVWLPGQTAPVVAGRLAADGNVVDFNYGRSYLARPGAIPLYLPELPLVRGRITPRGALRIAGCISDAVPDAWGQRVVLHRLAGRASADIDPAELGVLTYLLESGSDRTGALDFQAGPEVYEPRPASGTLEEMLLAAERLEAGEELSPALDAALFGGSSLGGARPKVPIDDGPRKLIAKFSSRADPYPVVKAEAAAMDLARRVGLDVAPTRLVPCLDRDVLLVERFDRVAGSAERKMVVSALTILELDELAARHATYFELADVVRERFTRPKRTLRELFARIVFNICVGNTDDHARNHAAFWDGAHLTLTPAYDVCPQTRTGGEAAQAMAIGRDGSRMSRLAGCVDAAPVYGLTPAEARAVIDAQLEVIHDEWPDAADAARLTDSERHQLWGRQILNPYALEGY